MKDYRAVDAAKIPPPGYPEAKNLQLMLKDKSTGKFYGMVNDRGQKPVSIYGTISFFNGQYFTVSGYGGVKVGKGDLLIDYHDLVEAPGGVLVGGKRRNSTRRKRRR
jgi:hypothetical protein